MHRINQVVSRLLCAVLVVASTVGAGEAWGGTGPAWNAARKDVLSASWSHSLLVHADGTVWSWGMNDSGELGDGTYELRVAPERVEGLTDVVSVSAGLSYSLALRRDGTVWAWGRMYPGEIRNEELPRYALPMRVEGLTDVVQIATGYYFCLALRADGTVWSWGSNSSDELGAGLEWYQLRYRGTPAPVVNLTDVVAIAAGLDHGLALRRDGTVWAWGRNITGELGGGVFNMYSVPLQTEGLTDVVSIAASVQSSAAIRRDGTMWAWGASHNPVQGMQPWQVQGLTDVVDVVMSNSHILAIRADGSVWSWGYNFFGQLGDGTQLTRLVPAEVPGLKHVIAVAGGQDHSVALRRDGTVWGWGASNGGLLGLEGSSNVLTPTRLPLPCRFNAVPSLEHGGGQPRECHETP